MKSLNISLILFFCFYFPSTWENFKLLSSTCFNRPSGPDTAGTLEAVLSLQPLWQLGIQKGTEKRLKCQTVFSNSEEEEGEINTNNERALVL